MQSTNTTAKESNLTKREIEVVSRIALEKSNREIAQDLHVTVGTIETHRRNIFNKMEVKNMAGLIWKVATTNELKRIIQGEMKNI